ncbi:MAG: DUF366 family protein [Bdellovibrio sp.]|nr:MAG: DUF366 family protein [Bdellovibrio sp.]
MKTKWIEKEFLYDGSQLRPLFSYMKYGLLGDSMISWIGPCEVLSEHMVDGEDKRQKASIRSDKMLHFLVEKFNSHILAAVSLQRLLVQMAKEQLEHLSGKNLRREGDDLYWEKGKLSISIASQGVTSSMIHFALNVTNQGTPVVTASLEDLNVDPCSFAKDLMTSFQKEIESIEQATQKVFTLPLTIENTVEKEL